MPLALRLDWSRCPDGYEVRDFGEWPSHGRRAIILDGERHGRWIQALSSRTEPVKYVLHDVADPIVFKFAQAAAEDALIGFCDEFGIPTGYGVVEKAESLLFIESEQRELRLLLALEGASAETIASVWPGANANITLGPRPKGLTPVMFLEFKSLVSFMRAEVALILSEESTVMSCAQCGKFFVSGAGRSAGSKRSGTIYCSTRCRVAATRARQRSG